MNTLSEPQWLSWSKRLQAIAQNGLTFAGDPFDIERYAESLPFARLRSES